MSAWPVGGVTVTPRPCCVWGRRGAPRVCWPRAPRGGVVTVWTQEGTVLGRLHLPGDEDVTSVVFSPSPSGLLYVAHGETVSALDPRSLKGAVEELRGAGEEEINSLALNETGSALAAADDSGVVRVLDLPGGRVSRTLRRHTNICSSVAFRPNRPNNLVSAGLDMQVMLWSLQKTRPLWTLNLQGAAEEEQEVEEEEEGGGGGGKLFNPPLAHCVSVASCGNVLACAAEDGRVHLLRVGAGSKLDSQGALKAHTQGASQAHFLSFLPSPHPYWLATGGNDGLVALWDLSRHPVVAGGEGGGSSSKAAKTGHVTGAGAGAAPPRRRTKARGKAKLQAQAKPKAQPKQARQEEEEKEEEEEKGEGDGEEEGGLAEAEEGSSSGTDPSVDTGAVPKGGGGGGGPKVSFAHGDKVNWVCPALLQGQPSLVVADQSPGLTVYSLARL